MNQHTTYNPNTIPSPANMVQSAVPPPQNIPLQQDTFINTSASIQEPMKPFDGLDSLYTPEEYLQQVEARIIFAIGEEPQNNPFKYKSRHNRRMAYIQCSLEQLLIGILIFISHINNGIHSYNYSKNNFHLKRPLITHK